jgi:succinate dehydrogenase / fumarate reductase cytochrome b subunit
MSSDPTTLRGASLRRAPRFFDLLAIRQPVTAVVSFGHRVSGVILALLIPVLAWMLQWSLSSPEGFAQVSAVLAPAWLRVVAVLLTWALAHHVFAGIRHLLFDLHVATAPPHRPEHLRPRAIRATAWAVLAAEAIVVIVAIVMVA